METFSFPGLNANELNDMQNIARTVFGRSAAWLSLAKAK